MMIIEIIKSTPTWVFLLFALLIFKGIMATQPKTIKLSKLFIMPILFLCLTKQKISYISEYFIVFLAIGCIIGWLIYKKTKIRTDKENKLLFLPGSIIPILLIIAAFTKGYLIGYTTAVYPKFAHTAAFKHSMMAISGILTGVFIGRTVIYLSKYHKAKHEDLSEIIYKSKGE
jgi:hypothetical protein